MALKNKRDDLFKRWTDDKYNIILLQDTHWTPESLISVKQEWDRKMISSTRTSNSKGTSILINNSFEYSLGKIVKDEKGNYVIIELMLPNDNNIIIGTVYGPNNDDEEFYTELDNVISSFNNPVIILGSDWNSTRDFSKDNNNYIAQNNLKNTKVLTKIINKYNLSDIWRLKNPNKRRYTWLQGISYKQARLDYFLCSEELISVCTKEDILYKYRSDHAPITITITLNAQPRGAGSWKFNNSFLKDEKFIKLIKEEIITFKLDHAATPYNQEYVLPKSSCIEFMSDPIMFWETLMVTLRGKIISYAIHKNKKIKNTKKEIEAKVKTRDLHLTSGMASREDLLKLKSLNDIINESYQQNIDGIILLIDFQKAFDSISREFIRNTMGKMNFGDSFLKWVNMFHMGSTSKITLNGHYSNSFPLERGCRQGDPISPFLFIICSEILTLAIKGDKNLKGLKLISKEHK